MVGSCICEFMKTTAFWLSMSQAKPLGWLLQVCLLGFLICELEEQSQG